MREVSRTARIASWQDLVSSLLTLLTLIALVSVVWLAPLLAQAGGERGQRLAERLFLRGLNMEDALRDGNDGEGYYEVLMNEGNDHAAVPWLLASGWTAGWKSRSQLRPPVILHRRQDFLWHDFEPRFKSDFTDLRTNGFGMADREYALQKPPRTRRIAVFGDSLGRGFGASFGRGWEPLLEERLNADHQDPEISGYEILNFSVDGYRVTQTLDVALETAGAFAPDVYLIALSGNAVAEKQWSWHLSKLLEDGRDLKYEYLRRIAADAGLRAGISSSQSARSLARFRTSTIHWVLSEIQSAAARRGASVVVVFVPTIDRDSTFVHEFADVYGVLHELDIPLIDLLDTFSGRQDLEALRFDHPYFKDDAHPNDRGYQLLFENLYRKLQERPEVLSQLLGTD